MHSLHTVLSPGLWWISAMPVQALMRETPRAPRISTSSSPDNPAHPAPPCFTSVFCSCWSLGHRHLCFQYKLNGCISPFLPLLSISSSSMCSMLRKGLLPLDFSRPHPSWGNKGCTAVGYTPSYNVQALQILACSCPHAHFLSNIWKGDYNSWICVF